MDTFDTSNIYIFRLKKKSFLKFTKIFFPKCRAHIPSDEYQYINHSIVSIVELPKLLFSSSPPHAMAIMTHPITPFTTPPTTHPKTTHLHLSTSISKATSLSQLKQVHTQILRQNLSDSDSDSLLFNLILSSIPLPSSLHYSLSVFSTLQNPRTHLINKLFRELSRSKEPHNALLFLENGRRNGLEVDRFSFPPLLKAASRAFALREGMEIHGLGCKLGFDSDPFIQTALLGMYANCGHIQDARLVFDKMSEIDIVAWDIMIDGYCQNGLFDDVLVLLEEMRSSNVEPDSRVFTTILSACGKTGNLAIGKVIHELISENNIIADSRLQSSLISMYSGCGCMDFAQSLYDKLSQKNLVVSTAMISGYSKAGQVEAARSIFDQITNKDLVCWSAMISGYAESDQPQEGLKFLDEMQASGVKPDQVTMLSVISACANLGALDQAKRIHLIVDKYRFREALPVNNALIDMFAKCGYLDGARGVFGQMRRKNVISWTSMISAYAIHGEADQALMLFRQMKEPNWITFVAVLYACSHAGLVDEGQHIFSSMMNEYNITPKLEHYGCMVDLYGRANRLREALELVETMPMAPNVVIWGSLMAACRIHGEFELGEFAAKRLLELDPEHDGAYVFLSNFYAKGKRWENVGEVRQLMKHKGILKERGHSKIEMDHEIHEFLTADKSHKHADDIYAKLDEVVCKLMQVGYAPNTSVVLIDVDEDEKKDVVLLHSEKLALCYGLLKSSNRGSPIHIIKNLRICEDCHNFMKLASKVFEREIVVRDRTRFHHYRGGSCSCKDYW